MDVSPESKDEGIRGKFPVVFSQNLIDFLNGKEFDEIWHKGYDLEKLNELYAIGEPIKETTEEQYKPYFEFANSEYYNYQVLEKHKNSIKELLVSNYGNIKYNGIIIPSTLVSDGPNKGIEGGKIDHYREIIFPDLPIKGYVFKTYRLVAEVWCHNLNPAVYTTVHHIGNDSYDNKNNLLFVTPKQHSLIRHVKEKRWYDLPLDQLMEEEPSIPDEFFKGMKP